MKIQVRSAVLLGVIVAASGGLATWKVSAEQKAEAAAASQPEPVEVVTAAVAGSREHRAAATAIGTVLATRSVMLRNEMPGTVRYVGLEAGRVVEAGAVLVAFDVSVEEAELQALQAQAELAEITLARVERMHERRASSAIELDNARAERDVALAQVARTRAVIARKTIRAPFRARVGIADVHPGQFLEAGTLLTSLQGVDEAAHVDFAVAQSVAAGLQPGDVVEVFADDRGGQAIAARIVAIDARVDPTTRSATVRARVDEARGALAPGASVRVRVPVGTSTVAVTIPVSALRKAPTGDHVFVLEDAGDGLSRAHVRQVQAGPVVGDEVVGVAGLDAGEQVAASGSFKLREAVLVSIAGAPVTLEAGQR
jgi:membrane fusion protein, multidrug efflux system